MVLHDYSATLPIAGVQHTEGITRSFFNLELFGSNCSLRLLALPDRSETLCRLLLA